MLPEWFGGSEQPKLAAEDTAGIEPGVKGGFPKLLVCMVPKGGVAWW